MRVPASGAWVINGLPPQPVWYAFLARAARLVEAGFPSAENRLVRPSERSPLAGNLPIAPGYYSLLCRVADLINEGMAASPGSPIVAHLPRLAPGTPLAGREQPTTTYYAFLSALVAELEIALAAI